MGANCSQLLAFGAWFLQKENRKIIKDMIKLPFKAITPEKREMCRLARKEAESQFVARRIAVGDGTYRLAEAGERGGQRFDIYQTKIDEIGLFGLGIAGYFSSMLGYSIMMLFLASVSTPTIIYFGSKAYSNYQPDISPHLKGTAICTRQEEVVVGYTDLGEPVMAVRNLCAWTAQQAILGLIGATCIGAFMVKFRQWLVQKIDQMDESVQTAQDYSVVVQDPDPDANDPDEWYHFFSQFGEVASVTVALANGELLEAMAERRFCKMMLSFEAAEDADVETGIQATREEVLQKLTIQNLKKRAVTAKRAELLKKLESFANKGQLQADALKKEEKKIKFATSVENTWIDSEIKSVNAAQVMNRFGMGKGAGFYNSQFRTHEENVQRCYFKRYPVAKVFVVFEFEAGQRNCLTTLNIGLIPALFDWATLEKRHLFRGQNALIVAEASEPSEVLYANLGKMGFSDTVKWRTIGTIVSLALTGAATYAIGLLFSKTSGVVTAVAISTLDEFVPGILVAITDRYEIYTTYSARQCAVLNKMFLFMICTTAIALLLFIPTEEMLSDTIIGSIFEILIVDALASPIMGMFSPSKIFRQKCVAPHAINFNKMQSYFQGEHADLGRLNALANKTVFLGLFYMGLLPSALYVVSAGLALRFWCDKASLFRRWCKQPEMGPALMNASAIHMIAALIGNFYVTARLYSAWPFDAACVIPDKNALNVTTVQGIKTLNYTSCRKASYSLMVRTGESWQSSQQSACSSAYMWLSLIIFTVTLVYYGIWAGYYGVRALFFGVNINDTDTTDIPFTTVDEVQTFVPEIRHDKMDSSLIACDVSGFDEEYLTVADPKRFNLFEEFQKEYDHALTVMGMDESEMEPLSGRLFSSCTVYPTKANPEPRCKVDSGDKCVGDLWVTILRGNELLAADTNTSDPFATLYYAGMKWETSVRHRTLNPLWDEDFKVPLQTFGGFLRILVKDYDLVGSNDNLGEAFLDLKHCVPPLLEVEEGQTQEKTIKLLPVGSFSPPEDTGDRASADSAPGSNAIEQPVGKGKDKKKSGWFSKLKSAATFVNSVQDTIKMTKSIDETEGQPDLGFITLKLSFEPNASMVWRRERDKACFEASTVAFKAAHAVMPLAPSEGTTQKNDPVPAQFSNRLGWNKRRRSSKAHSMRMVDRYSTKNVRMKTDHNHNPLRPEEFLDLQQISTSDLMNAKSVYRLSPDSPKPKFIV